MLNRLTGYRSALVECATATSIAPDSRSSNGSDGIFRVCQIAGMAIVCGFILTASSYAFWAIT
ncbi:hypothetical protein MnTg02_02774 [bacterium MnTg02]|nr:hypothetical protein MnTg02_02774 [bacterium MnTg02]